ncbi:MAG: GFA family protein [Elainellaceae cyanobacterium]
MTSSNPTKASCLCGSVELIAASKVHKVDACHCDMCRKWGGGPLLAVECGSEVEISGMENVTAYDSSDWAERGFCSKCGTHLFYRFKSENNYVLPAGLFDEQDGFTLEEQIFIDRKPSYYEFANATHNMTEAEVFEKYMSKSE